ncbi:MAG: hypothetical protein KGH90_10050 [Xanthomonadaceae bacterium]|nr:hypothetical protein [Xanthomonadaceae bacterium]
MVKLAIDQSPASSLPRRFLLSAPPWGMAAGALLLFGGAPLLATRWQPATVALVHAFTLGVLGNTMFGSVLQFLPAAAGVRVRAATALGHALHGLFNAGAIVLLIALLTGWRTGLAFAGVLLPAAFLLLGAMTLPGMLVARGQRLLRTGIGLALLSAMLTALLGGGLALGLSGRLPMPAWPLVDVHAGWGILGWIVLLLASVARVVMPMFQGTSAPSATAQAGWTAAVVLALGAATWRALACADASWLRLALGLLVGAFAVAALWLQWRSPRARDGALLRSWRLGLLVLLLAALALLWGIRDGRLAGALGLAVALPLLLNGMSLEIVAFLGWIELHRRIGRGVQLPGVQRLLPEADKHRVLLMQLPPALLLPAAVLWPAAWLTRLAGLAMFAAWFACWLALTGVQRRSRRFARNLDTDR